jgi:hypothetical protein
VAQTGREVTGEREDDDALGRRRGTEPVTGSDKATVITPGYSVALQSTREMRDVE